MYFAWEDQSKKSALFIIKLQVCCMKIKHGRLNTFVTSKGSDVANSNSHTYDKTNYVTSLP